MAYAGISAGIAIGASLGTGVTSSFLLSTLGGAAGGFAAINTYTYSHLGRKAIGRENFLFITLGATSGMINGARHWILDSNRGAAEGGTPVESCTISSDNFGNAAHCN